jgi:hypothetical protein
MSQDLPDGLAGLEAALKGLAPEPPQLDRDQLLFRAGQASARRAGRLWPWATGVLGLVAAGLGLALVLQPEPPVRERVVVVYQPAKEPAEKDPLRGLTPPARQSPVAAPRFAAASPEADRLSYGVLWGHVQRWGIEGLPLAVPVAPPGKAAPPSPVPSYQQLRVSLQTGGEL